MDDLITINVRVTAQSPLLELALDSHLEYMFILRLGGEIDFLSPTNHLDMSVPLTTHLASLSTPRPYAAATQHAFLTAAGTGTLPHPLLSLYLSQDRIYAAHGYPRFIGQLLTRIPYSSTHALDSPEEQLHSDVVKLLAFALQNVQHEIGMVKRKYKQPQLRAVADGKHHISCTSATTK